MRNEHISNIHLCVSVYVLGPAVHTHTHKCLYPLKETRRGTCTHTKRQASRESTQNAQSKADRTSNRETEETRGGTGGVSVEEAREITFNEQQNLIKVIKLVFKYTLHFILLCWFAGFSIHIYTYIYIYCGFVDGHTQHTHTVQSHHQFCMCANYINRSIHDMNVRIEKYQSEK